MQIRLTKKPRIETKNLKESLWEVLYEGGKYIETHFNTDCARIQVKILDSQKLNGCMYSLCTNNISISHLFKAMNLEEGETELFHLCNRPGLHIVNTSNGVRKTFTLTPCAQSTYEKWKKSLKK